MVKTRPERQRLPHFARFLTIHAQFRPHTAGTGPPPGHSPKRRHRPLSRTLTGPCAGAVLAPPRASPGGPRSPRNSPHPKNAGTRGPASQKQPGTEPPDLPKIVPPNAQKRPWSARISANVRLPKGTDGWARRVRLITLAPIAAICATPAAPRAISLQSIMTVRPRPDPCNITVKPNVNEYGGRPVTGQAASRHSY